MFHTSIRHFQRFDCQSKYKKYAAGTVEPLTYSSTDVGTDSPSIVPSPSLSKAGLRVRQRPRKRPHSRFQNSWFHRRARQTRPLSKTRGCRRGPAGTLLTFDTSRHSATERLNQPSRRTNLAAQSYPILTQVIKSKQYKQWMQEQQDTGNAGLLDQFSGTVRK